MRTLAVALFGSLVVGLGPGACSGAEQADPDRAPADHEPAPKKFSVQDEHVGALRVGMSSAEVVTLLGEPQAPDEFSADGEFGDFIQAWSFPEHGLWLHMASPKAEPVDQVLRGILATQSFSGSLPRGLKIGSSRDELQRAYGDHEFVPLRSATRFVAGSIAGGSTYTLESDEITSVYVGPEN